MITARTNSREWERQVIRQYLRVRRNKTEPEVINRLGQKACWRAQRSTTKARLGKFPLNKTADPDKGGRTRKQRFYYALMAKKGHKRGQGIKAAADKEYKRRRSAKGAIAAGFFNSIKAFGGTVRARSFKGKANSSVAKSYGRKARRGFGKMKGLSANLVDGAGIVAKPAMDKAIREQLQDMQNWAIKELQKTDNKFSAKNH